MSAATMADPGSPKKRLLNGSSSIYFPFDCRSLGRRLSEPSLLSLQSDILPLTPLLSKDDTYTCVDHEGGDRSPPQTLGSAYVARPRFDPRRLLDPKGYNALQAKKEDSAIMVMNRVFTAGPESLLTTSRSGNEMRTMIMVWEI